MKANYALRKIFCLLCFLAIMLSLLVSCASIPLDRPFPNLSNFDVNQRIAEQANDDPLVGIWRGSQCGYQIILGVFRDDVDKQQLWAVILNGKELQAHGYYDGHPWFLVSRSNIPNVYEGKIIYRNKFVQRWYPTRVVVNGPNSFTTNDDVSLPTCGGTRHTYARSEVIEKQQSKSGARGSGLLIGNTNFVLTANHVISDRTSINVSLPNDKIYGASVIARDLGNDIALLALKDFVPSPARGFKINPQITVAPGEIVHALGYPLGDTLSRYPSIVTGNVSSNVGLKDSANAFRMTAPINAGNSGGPIVNEQGIVVGIAVSALRGKSVEGVSFGIKISSALSVLQQATIPFYAVDEKAMRPHEIFSKYSKDVAFIEAKP